MREPGFAGTKIEPDQMNPHPSPEPKNPVFIVGEKGEKVQDPIIVPPLETRDRRKETFITTPPPQLQPQPPISHLQKQRRKSRHIRCLLPHPLTSSERAGTGVYEPLSFVNGGRKFGRPSKEQDEEVPSRLFSDFLAR